MYSTEEKDKLVKREINKLKKIYKEEPDDKRKSVEKLIENAAWMAVSLTELKGLIDEYGYTESYQNGEHQSGTKDSTYVRAYNTMIKNYNSTIKLLLDNLKTDGSDSEKDKLAKFFQGRDC